MIYYVFYLTYLARTSGRDSSVVAHAECSPQGKGHSYISGDWWEAEGQPKFIEKGILA
jgi:hypothetical protein